MAWIKVDHATPTKPEVLRIARLLSITTDDAFGKLCRVWLWFDVNSVDGHVDGAVDGDVDALVSFCGFAAAMRATAWLGDSETGNGLTLPNFDNHNGETAKTRALKQKRQAKWRQNRDGAVDGRVGQSPSTRASTRVREDKNRIEKSSTLIQDLGNNQFMGSERVSAEQVQPPARTRKRPAKSDRDERTDQPAIQLVRELMNRYPPKATWDEIILALGTEPDRVRLSLCWVEWNKRGFKPNNLAWLFHWYRNGVPAAGPPGNGKAKGPTKEELLAAHYAFIKRHSNGQNTGSEQILGDADGSTGDVREEVIL